MNKSSFVLMTQSGYRFQSADIKQLMEVVNEFPYFSLAKILLAKASFNSSDISFEKFLNQASLSAPDRVAMFDFMFSAAGHEVILPVEKPALESKPEIVTPHIEHIDENKHQPDTIEAPNETPQVIVEETGPAQIKPLVSADGTEVKSKDDLRDIVRRELERIDRERAEAKEAIVKGEKTPVKVVETSKKTSELVDKFIQNQPSISKPGDEKYDDMIRLAKQSLEDHYDFVSETLAEIYFKQNNPQKAIKIYEQLILKLPEKKLYFAARIKEIVENK